MGVKLKVSYEQPNHESLLMNIKSALAGYQKKEGKRRASKNAKFGNKYGDSLNTEDKKLQHSFYSSHTQDDERSYKI